jgi:hypothetical protein
VLRHAGALLDGPSEARVEVGADAVDLAQGDDLVDEVVVVGAAFATDAIEALRSGSSSRLQKVASARGQYRVRALRVQGGRWRGLPVLMVCFQASWERRSRWAPISSAALRHSAIRSAAAGAHSCVQGQIGEVRAVYQVRLVVLPSWSNP